VRNSQMLIVSAVKICKKKVSANCYSFWELRKFSKNSGVAATPKDMANSRAQHNMHV